MKSQFKYLLTLTIAAISFVGCSSSEEVLSSVQNDVKLDVVNTYSNSPSDVAATKVSKHVLSEQDAIRIKQKGVIIEHTFSNKEKVRFQNVADHAVYDRDIAIVSTAKLPEYIAYIEDEIEKRTKLSTQSISLNPSGCSLSIIFCVNPTSNYLWSTRTIPYYFDVSMTSVQRTAFTNSVNSWNGKSGQTIKWQINTAYTGSDRAVRITSVDAGDVYCGQAFIGYQGRVVTSGLLVDFINLNNNAKYNCFTDRTIHHEMGHVVGLPHEQDRCDRDNYIVFTKDLTGKRCGGDFTTWNRGFDFSSIMLYDSPGILPKRNASNVYIGSTSYTGNPNIDIQNTVLSATDIATMNSMYTGR
jgi:hypothetical protein